MKGPHMNTIAEPDSRSLASSPRKTKTYAQKQEIIRKQLRYEELDAEFFREHRRLNRLVRQLKKSMIKKLD
jgi:hypothetical protein